MPRKPSISGAGRGLAPAGASEDEAEFNELEGEEDGQNKYDRRPEYRRPQRIVPPHLPRAHVWEA